MILLLAVLLGLLAGMVRAELGKRHYRSLELKSPWLVIIAFLAQLVVSELHHLGINMNDEVAALVLLTGQILLFAFCLINLKNTGFSLLVLGTFLNLLVMLANHGLMPISPATITNLYPRVPNDTWIIGHHLWNSKNIVLTEDITRMSFLADRFLIPSWSPYRVAFSLGDVLLSCGAFWLLWNLGGSIKKNKEINHEKMEFNHSAVRKD